MRKQRWMEVCTSNAAILAFCTDANHGIKFVRNVCILKHRQAWIFFLIATEYGYAPMMHTSMLNKNNTNMGPDTILCWQHLISEAWYLHTHTHIGIFVHLFSAHLIMLPVQLDQKRKLGKNGGESTTRDVNAETSCLVRAVSGKRKISTVVILPPRCFALWSLTMFSTWALYHLNFAIFISTLVPRMSIEYYTTAKTLLFWKNLALFAMQ